MNKQKDYVIPFKGLSTGTHQYQFELGKSFFESFEFFESESGKLFVDIELVKESALLDFHFKINGNVDLACDRCLVKFTETVDGEFRLVVKFGEEYAEESDEIIILPAMESSIDLKQYLFEYVNLLLPIKRVHENENDCDPDMMEKLKYLEDQKTDPRWDALKDIKLK